MIPANDPPHACEVVLGRQPGAARSSSSVRASSVLPGASAHACARLKCESATVVLAEHLGTQSAA